MIFIHDTRDQAGKHKNLEEWMEREGHTLVRSKMYVGDIALLHDQSTCIDLKSLGLTEVYNNLVQSHNRFRDECIRAKEANIKLIVLVEEKGVRELHEVKNWQNPQQKRWEKQNAYNNWLIAHGREPYKPTKPPVPSDRLMGMMDAMSQRYGVEWVFCHPDRVGEFVYRLLTLNE